MYKHKLANTADKTILGLKVVFPPSAAAPPHTHHGASVSVLVLSGSVFNKMNDDPMTIEKIGNSFYESPKCRHRISANASKTEEASILATFVLETEKLNAILDEGGAMGLVAVDEEWGKVIQEYMENAQ